MQKPIQSIYQGKLGAIRFSSVQLFERKFGTTSSLSLKYVIKGKENYVVEGKTFEVNTEELLFFSEGVGYTAFTRDNSTHKGFCIDLSNDFMSYARKDIFGEESLFQLADDFKAIKLSAPGEGFLNHLKGLSAGVEKFSPIELEEKLNELMLLYLHLEYDFSQKIQALPSRKTSVRKETFRKLLLSQAFIHENKTRNLCLEEIAMAAGISKFYLQRLFSQTFGKSPAQYQEALRMEEAKRRIQMSSDSISEICYELGYNDLGYFSRRFKKHSGLSPRQFRKRR